jgi:hypothetical protein
MVAILGLIVASGCRTVVVDATRDELTPRPKKDREETVAVYRDELPERPHKAIGSVRAKVKLSPYRDTTWPDDRVLDAMKTKARRLGADALVNLRIEQLQGGSTTLSPNGTILTGNTQTWIATAVVWLDDSELDATPSQ